MSTAEQARHILVIEDQKSRRIVPLQENTYAIGRDPHNGILLYDRQVSRHHATLLRVTDYQSEKTAYRVIDGNLQGKKSTNGIVVNGKYCLSHELKHGDQIRFGNKSKASYQIVSNASDLDLLKVSNSSGNGQSFADSLFLDAILSETSTIPPNEELPQLAAPLVSDPSQTIVLEKDLEPQPVQKLPETNALAEFSPHPIIELNFQGEIIYLNPAAHLKFSNLKPALSDHPILAELLNRELASDGTVFVREIQVDRAFFEQHVYYFPQEQRVRSYLFEITAYKQRESQLSNAKDRYRLFAEQSSEGILLVDADSKRVLEANHAYCELAGYSSAELIGESLYQLITLEREALDRQLQQVNTQEPHTIDKLLLRAREGSPILVSSKISWATYQGQAVWCWAVRDIRSFQQLEEQLKYQSLHDPVTQLPNQTFFTQQLERALERAQHHQHLMAVIFLDLDSFSYINNTAGHAIGDRLLHNFAQRLSSIIHPGNTLARWGSDEFALLLPQIKNTEETAKLSQQIFDALALPFEIERSQFAIKCSIGIAIYPQDGEDSQSLLKNADTALHRTKAQGRNHYQFYNPDLTAEAAQIWKLEGLLHRALEKKQFSLHYQPQINLATGKVTGMEALLRWEHPQLGVIAPRQFLPLAQKTDLILQLGKWVLKTACQQALAWQKDNLPLRPIAVNLSAREFGQSNLAEVVARVLDETGLDPQWLELEITELILRQHLNSARKTLQDLQNLGVRIALDDFGEGIAALGYLKYFAFRTLKLHQTFIRDMRDRAEDRAIVSAILALGRGFNLRIVAEGVETQQQLDILTSLQCEEAQGYWFSRPLEAKAATEFLMTNHQ